MSICSPSRFHLLGAVAGVIYALSRCEYYIGAFGFNFTDGKCMMFIGAMPWGCLISAPMLWVFPRVLPEGIVQYTNMIYGAILVIVMVFFPQGLITRRGVSRLAGLIHGKPRMLSPNSLCDPPEYP